MADWSQLPTLLVDRIVRRLTVVVDHLKFSWVCSSWRSAALDFRPYFPPPLPGLMIDDGKMRFFASLSNKAYIHPLPIPRTEVVVRSSGGSLGSLVTVDEHHHHLHILNPFSNLRVPLPLPPVSDMFAVAALSSSNPNNAIVMLSLMKDFRDSVAFARPGDISWSVIVEKKIPYNDIIFYKGAYILQNIFGIFVCDIEDPNPKTTRLIALPIVALPHSYHLVESAGELLLVFRYIRYIPDAFDDAFDVYMLDMSMNKWKQVDTLGDRALFLCYCTSFSVSSLNYEDCSSDCIYFTNDHQGYQMGKRLGHDMGIFNLKDRSTKRFRFDEGVWVTQPLGPDYGIRNANRNVRSGPIWVTPLPWSKEMRRNEEVKQEHSRFKGAI